MSREVKQGRKFTRSATCMSGIRKTCTGISQFVEERLNHRIDCRQSLGWCVLQKSRDQIDCIWRSLPKNLIKRMRLDLRKFVLHVVWIHGADLVARRSSQDFDDLDELVDTRFAGKKRLAQHELCHHAACRPHIFYLLIQIVKRNWIHTYRSWWCSSWRRRSTQERDSIWSKCRKHSVHSQPEFLRFQSRTASTLQWQGQARDFAV